MDFLGDMIRSMAYSVAIFWFARTKTQQRLPCVYINNLELFLQDIECKRLFRKYLISRGGHAKMLDLTASMMETSMEGTEDFLASEDNSRLHSHFQEFQQTKSFKYLAREIQIAEQVEALSFETR